MMIVMHPAAVKAVARSDVVNATFVQVGKKSPGAIFRWSGSRFLDFFEEKDN